MVGEQLCRCRLVAQSEELEDVVRVVGVDVNPSADVVDANGPELSRDRLLRAAIDLGQRVGQQAFGVDEGLVDRAEQSASTPLQLGDTAKLFTTRLGVGTDTVGVRRHRVFLIEVDRTSRRLVRPAIREQRFHVSVVERVLRTSGFRYPLQPPWRGSL